jgi:very-short-patch-repair endonuclease
MKGGLDKMPRKRDLTNMVFNRLKVIGDSGKRDAGGSILWTCVCQCGKETLATGTALKNNHKKSCGCLAKEKITEIGKSNLIDLTNQTFEKLTVIKRVSTSKTPSGATKIFWLCQCKCGNQCVVEGNALKSGNTKSCGCIKSFGEQKIISLLQSYGLPFEKEKIFDKITNYRYDFYVNNQYVIEYDGKQHFQDSSWESQELIHKRDMEKNNFCYVNNIPIIRIPYTHYNQLNINDLLLETTNFLLREETTDGTLD